MIRCVSLRRFCGITCNPEANVVAGFQRIVPIRQSQLSNAPVAPTGPPDHMEVSRLGTNGIAEHLIAATGIYIVVVMNPFCDIST